MLEEELPVSIFSNPAARAKGASEAYVRAMLDVLGGKHPVVIQGELLGELRKLSADLTDAELRQPEAPGKWSIIQVLEHLTDQEIVNSFRLRAIIAEDEPRIQGYDQDRWAERLRYGGVPAEQLLAELAPLRARNLRLYASLTSEDWERSGIHSERGPESARRLCSLIAAHDLVHRRQIARIRSALRR
jgi:hypothetical protein